MAKSANLLLSADELQLVSDERWIRMKETILEKMAGVLGDLPPLIDDCMQENIPDFNIHRITSPKISRGERYQGLPYLVLDYPREFGKEDVFAIRTMFWWAHNFTIHLHLAGKFRTLFEERISKNITSQAGMYVCINNDPWQHEVAEDNYVPVADEKPSYVLKVLHEHPFIKIATVVPLHEWNNVEAKFRERYLALSRLFA